MSFWFELLYYFSSLAPQYIMILVILCLKNSYKNKFLILIISICLISSSSISILIMYILNHIKKRRSGHYKVRLSYKINPGFGEFFLNSLIPLIAIFPSISNNQNTSFIIISLFQFSIFIFYRISSDTLPNLPLSLFGINIYTMNKSQKNVPKSRQGHMRYIIGKSHNNRRIYCGKIQTVISIRSSDPYSLFAIIK